MCCIMQKPQLWFNKVQQRDRERVSNVTKNIQQSINSIWDENELSDLHLKAIIAQHK